MAINDWTSADSGDAPTVACGWGLAVVDRELSATLPAKSRTASIDSAAPHASAAANQTAPASASTAADTRFRAGIRLGARQEPMPSRSAIEGTSLSPRPLRQTTMTSSADMSAAMRLT